jgi:hypothetical protein
MEPSNKEILLHKTAKLLHYALTSLNREVPARVQTASTTMYCTIDLVPDLCKLLTDLTAEQRETIIYNSHCSAARDLATWWEQHQVADAHRKDREAVAARRMQVRKGVLMKLTLEEQLAVFTPPEIAELAAM